MEIKSIAQLVIAKSRQFGDRQALCLSGKGATEQYTYRQLDQVSGQLAHALIGHGVQAGDPVALLCESRPRWGAVFFAILRAGGVVVPLDTRMPAAELAKILTRVKPRLLLVSREHESLAGRIGSQCETALAVVSLEAADEVLSYPSIEAGTDNVEAAPCVIRSEYDAAVISFTSGTTGSSKGVVTTHGNLLFQLRSVQHVICNGADTACYSILPLSHLFELTAGFLAVLNGGGKIVYGSSLLPEDIFGTIAEHRVNCMATVPLFLRVLSVAVNNQLARQSWSRRKLFNLALRISPLLTAAARRRLFSPIHEKLGNSLEYFVSGGAPLDKQTLTFFNRLGLPVFQGYGLAETSPVIATNSPSANRTGSVGRPLPGVQVRISNNGIGEILTRGPHVMRGYLDDPRSSSALIDADGWLHTGDMGYLDSDGYLYVSGRLKNVIVLGDGKKVQPEEIEDTLFSHPWIQEGCIVGRISEHGLTRGSEEVCAVAVASEEAIRRCERESLDLGELVRSAIKTQAQRLSAFKQPTHIILSRKPLPRTSSEKIRRHNLLDWLKKEAVLS
jgi:long-chain acyl-CoA synthetase